MNRIKRTLWPNREQCRSSDLEKLIVRKDQSCDDEAKPYQDGRESDIEEADPIE